MRQGYSGLQIGLHWAIAVLIGANYLLGEGMGWALRQRLEKDAEPGLRATLHVWIGLTVLALVVIRLIVRFRQGAPEAPAGTPRLLHIGRGIGHFVLYAMMIGVPVGGAIVWFGGVRAFGELHEVGGNLIVLVAGLHAVVALFHHYVLKDGLLLRMMRPG